MARTGVGKLWPTSQVQPATCFEQPTKNTAMLMIYMFPVSAFML